ncbi:MAG: hypothetical protein IPK85_04795 [Gemmatimonadetes bacterium]|nr:hypothetical protein [Gemmatimonadota bacterium]
MSVDEAFQRTFNGYYRVRRAATWRTALYRLFEERKERGVQFDQVIRDLHAATGRVEASFASKLVATLDPAQPVIDQLVLKNVHLRLATYGDAATRLQRATDVHSKLRDLFATFLATREGRAFIRQFDDALGGEALTATKKLDLVLWQAR